MSAFSPPRRRPPAGPKSAARPPAAAPAAVIEPLSEDELEQLQDLLDGIPEPLEPLDVTMLDGFLCGVIVQPEPPAEAVWWPHVLDMDARPLPPRHPAAATAALRGLVRRRYAELSSLIARRQWFDPWVYELDEDASPSETVMPWVAGFAAALNEFPGLMGMKDSDLLEPLAVLYAHLDPDDLEDAEELLAEIESLEPAADLPAAVEGLVCSVLLLADVARPPLAALRGAAQGRAAQARPAGAPARRPAGPSARGPRRSR